MPLVSYPAELPTPSGAAITPRERRLLSDLPGVQQVRAIQRDFCAEEDLTWFALSAEEAEAFQAWWEDTLLRGGSWFASTWPLPEGWIAGVRRFMTSPTWEHIPGGYWRVSARTEVRGRSLPPYRHVSGEWEDRAMPITTSWYDVAWSQELGLFVAVGTGDKCATSPDGNVWTARNMPSSATWTRVDWIPGLALFVATGFISNKAATSPDGTTWTARTLPVSGSWAGMAWNGTTLVCVENGGISGSRVVLTSTDAVTWTAHSTAMPSVGTWDGLVWCQELGYFVCIASFSTKAATSPDGVTWTQRTLPSSSYWVDLAWNGSMLVATDYTAATTKYLTSPDGITWTQRVLPVATKWGGVSWNDTRNLFCMVGNGEISLLSPTGLSWTESPMDSSRNWFKVIWGKGAGCFIAVAEGSSPVCNRKVYD